MPQEIPKTCLQCNSAFLVDQPQLEFLHAISPVVSGNKCSIPPPTHCPACRLQRRLAFRNPISVGWRVSAVTGKKLISAFLDEARAKVIENEIWWSDSWSAQDFAAPFDFSRPFFAQFQRLRDAVPYAARLTTNGENSEYCSNADGLKDCYFVFNTLGAESSLYCDYIWGAKSCVDCTRTVQAELCYDCLETPSCYNLQSSEFSSNCRDSWFLSQCHSCSDCFGCANLSHKRFCVFNTPQKETDYRAFIASMNLASYSQRVSYEKKWRELKSTLPRPHQYGQRVEDCTGNYLESSARVRDSFFVIGGEDLRFCFVVNSEVKNCQDYSHFGSKTQNIYECQSVGQDAFQVLFCRDCWNGNSDLIYCASCFGCHDCFGCVGLRKKQHCILNTQYSAAEYADLAPRVIASMRTHSEWGEFFPISTSPFPYNTSFAIRYFPLTEAEALKRGFGWFHYDEADSNSAIKAEELPDDLPATDAPILVLSAGNQRPFRITTQEIKRYRGLRVPLPRTSYVERMENRWARLGGIVMHQRTSALSGIPLETSLDAARAPLLWHKSEWDAEVR